MNKLRALTFSFLAGCVPSLGANTMPESNRVADTDAVDAGSTSAVDGGAPADLASAVDGNTPTQPSIVNLDVIAGIDIPLNTPSNATGTWTQAAGATAPIASATAAIAYATLPATAKSTDTFAFHFTQGNAITATVNVAIHDANPVQYLTKADLPAPPSGETWDSEGITFNASGLWAANPTAHMVSLFDKTAKLTKQVNVNAFIESLNFDVNGQLVMADTTHQSIIAMNPATNAITTVGGGALGASNYALVDKSGNVYVSNNFGEKVYRFDATTKQATLFIDYTNDADGHPNALTFGPEPDCLYVGLWGRVDRVHIAANGTVASREVYVDNLKPKDTCTVDGLRFDAGRNLYVGCPNEQTMYVIKYSTSETQPSRTVTDNLASFFTNPTFGNADFGTTTLYWTDVATFTVGKMALGLPTLQAPLLPPQ